MAVIKMRLNGYFSKNHKNCTAALRQSYMTYGGWAAAPLTSVSDMRICASLLTVHHFSNKKKTFEFIGPFFLQNFG